MERPYTPLIKQLLPANYKARVPLSAPLLPGEGKYIIKTAEILNEYYGSPKFDYSKVDAKD